MRTASICVCWKILFNSVTISSLLTSRVVGASASCALCGGTQQQASAKQLRAPPHHCVCARTLVEVVAGAAAGVEEPVFGVSTSSSSSLVDSSISVSSASATARLFHRETPPATSASPSNAIKPYLTGFEKVGILAGSMLVTGCQGCRLTCGHTGVAETNGDKGKIVGGHMVM